MTVTNPSFEQATAVHPLPEHAATSPAGEVAASGLADLSSGRNGFEGPLVYQTDVPNGWDIFGNTNGGTLLAPVARAACHASGRPDPVAVSAHYLQPGRPGPATITLVPTHQTRRFSTFQATLSNEAGPLLTAVVTTGDLDDHDGPFFLDRTPPEIPPPADCVQLGNEDGAPNFSSHVTMSIFKPDAEFFGGGGERTGRLRGWVRLPGETLPDGFGLIQAIDSFPPAAFNTGVGLAYSPTLQLSTHMRARPKSRDLLVDTVTRSIGGGFAEIEETVWDDARNLVAQGRQLCVVRTAPTS